MKAEWAAILDGTALKPSAFFFEFLREYVRYDSIDAGIPAGYVSVRYGSSSKTTWVTDAHAVMMETALLDLRACSPFAYDVFFKFYFKHTPVCMMMTDRKTRTLFTAKYQWDGSADTLNYQLDCAHKFLFSKLRDLTGVTHE